MHFKRKNNNKKENKMIRKSDCIETNYNRHIRKAREAAKGYQDYERALKICEYFNAAGHPHPDSTFNLVRFNDAVRQSDRQFAIKLMKEMAYTVATGDALEVELNLD
jgi:hypothetical protein